VRTSLSLNPAVKAIKLDKELFYAPSRFRVDLVNVSLMALAEGRLCRKLIWGALHAPTRQPLCAALSEKANCFPNVTLRRL
jgi:hypothetical protein